MDKDRAEKPSSLGRAKLSLATKQFFNAAETFLEER